MTWTEHQDNILRDRISAGDTMGQAAAVLRVTRNAVAGRMMRLGIRSHNPNGGKTCTSGNRPPKPVRVPKPVKLTDGRRKVFSTVYRLADTVAPTPNKAEAFKPLDGTNPKHWTERTAFECSWPVGPDGADQRSCCAPVVKGSWCDVHHRLGHTDTPRFRMIDPDRRRAGR
jgi:GcrA cell cycle regulator